MRVTFETMPQFLVEQIDWFDGHLHATGTFSTLNHVEAGDAVLRAREPDGHWVDGVIQGLDLASRRATFLAYSMWPEVATVGSRLAYLERWGFHQFEVLDLIADETIEWVRVRFTPTDALDYVMGDVRVLREWDPAFRIPEGATSVARIPEAYNSAHCVVCDARIGDRGQEFAYRPETDVQRGQNSIGAWLCEADYARYAAEHDLSFIYRQG